MTGKADRDLEWLRTEAKGDEQKAQLVYWIERGLDKHDAAAQAGYSAGRSRDPAKQKKALQTSASAALKSKRVQALIDSYRDYKRRVSGDAPPPQIASEKEVLLRLSEVMRHANDAKVVSAARRLLDHHSEMRRPEVTPGLLVQSFVARVGAENTRRGLRLLGSGHLVYERPDLFAGLPDDDLDGRLTALEKEHERTERADDDVASPDGGGARRTSEAIEAEVDGGPGDAGDAGGRDGARGRARDGDGGKVTPEDEAKMRDWQRSIGLG